MAYECMNQQAEIPKKLQDSIAIIARLHRLIDTAPGQDLQLTSYDDGFHRIMGGGPATLDAHRDWGMTSTCGVTYCRGMKVPTSIFSRVIVHTVYIQFVPPSQCVYTQYVLRTYLSNQ